MIKLSTDFADALAQAAALHIDDNQGDAAVVKLYDGVRPANVAEVITSQVLIAEITLPEGSPFVFREATEDFVAYELSTSNPVFITTAGDASFFRLFNNNGDAIMDGDVSDPLGTGDMKISVTAVNTGFLLKIVSFIYRIAKNP